MPALSSTRSGEQDREQRCNIVIFSLFGPRTDSQAVSSAAFSYHECYVIDEIHVLRRAAKLLSFYIHRSVVDQLLELFVPHHFWPGVSVS